MTTIHVLFPKAGVPAVVMNDTEAVIKGQAFTWAIKTEDPSIRRVRIKFKKGQEYFGTGTSKTHFQDRDLVNNVASIWGVPPMGAPAGGAGDPRADEYEVIGYDGNGESVSFLDPKILPTDP